MQLATLFGMLTALLSGLAAFVILVLSVAGAVNASVWVWVLVAVLFLSGVQLITVGILGRYLAQVHEEVRSRPLYLIDWIARPSERGGVETLGAPAGAAAASDDST